MQEGEHPLKNGVGVSFPSALASAILLVLFAGESLAQQIPIGRIDGMPNAPSPYLMRNWKAVAASFDSIAFDASRTGRYLPLIQLYTGTVNYPGQECFRIQSYVGSPGYGGEAVTCLPAIVSASLVGINKSNQAGTNWVVMGEEWFNGADGQNVYLNTPSSGTGDDWWYETMPNVFAFQIASLYPATGDFGNRIPVVASRWRAAIAAMGGSTKPWSLANVNHRAFNLITMKPNDSSVPEPEAAGAIAWLLYAAYCRTGNQDFRIGAELSLESLLVYATNPSYELQLPYGTYIAARMNAELGTSYDVTKMMNWCFSNGNLTLRQWGAIVGNWGGYDCSGLIGEASTSNDYAFFMNGAEQAGALVPLVRYDDRYARAVGKWVLNVANASRLFYAGYLPDDHQDSAAWAHQYDPLSSIAHESMHQFSLSDGAVSPFATGDAARGGWAATNFGLYGAAHAGILGGIIDTTNVAGILRLDLLKTDYFHAAAYPTYCYFNPYASDTAVTLALGAGSYDLYNTVTKGFIATGATGTVSMTISAGSVSVVVIAPAGGAMTKVLDKTLINSVVVDYRNGYSGNHPPRIKSLSPDSARMSVRTPVNIYCSAADRDSDALTYSWSASRGTIAGNGPVVTWTAPDSPGVCVVTCTVDDGHGGNAAARDTLQVVAFITHPPVILRMAALPRKVDLGASSAVSCVVSNPDSNALTFTWSASAGSISGTGPAVAWRAPASPSNDVVRVSVDDGKGGHDADSIGLEVRDLSVQQTGNLVAYYPMDGSASDASGNGHNGSASGVVPANDRLGHPSGAYAFDGSAASIVVPDDSALNFQSAVTVNLWVKPAALYAGREQYIISHGSWQNRWKISVTPGTNALRWTVKNAALQTRDLDSASPLVLDSVMNVTARYDGTDMELYINGALNAFTPFSGLINTTSYALTMGQDLPTDNLYGFNGVLDDVRLYDYGLGLAQIASLSDFTSGVRPVTAEEVPPAFGLYANFPNPFNPSTNIRFDVARRQRTTLRVYDVLGRDVTTLVDGIKDPGTYTVRFDASNLASGVYFYRLQSGDFAQSRRLVVVK